MLTIDSHQSLVGGDEMASGPQGRGCQCGRILCGSNEFDHNITVTFKQFVQIIGVEVVRNSRLARVHAGSGSYSDHIEQGRQGS